MIAVQDERYICSKHGKRRWEWNKTTSGRSSRWWRWSRWNNQVKGMHGLRKRKKESSNSTKWENAGKMHRRERKDVNHDQDSFRKLHEQSCISLSSSLLFLSMKEFPSRIPSFLDWRRQKGEPSLHRRVLLTVSPTTRVAVVLHNTHETQKAKRRRTQFTYV